MTSRIATVAVICLTFTCASIQSQTSSGPAALTNLATAPQAPLPAPGREEVLRVFTGKSLVLRSPLPLKRVSVSDPAVAAAITVAPDQVLINGLKPGSATLLLWDEQEQLRSFELQVRTDIRALRDSIQQLFPKESIQVTQSGAAVLLNGVVSNQGVIDRTLALAQSESPGVVSMLQVKPPASDVIMLQVRFAEVDRTAIQQLGANLMSTGAANTFGAISTQQFSQLTASVGGSASGTNSVSGGIGNTLAGTPASFGMSNLLNIFLFRPDVNLGMTIQALEQQNVLQILAEPNLMAYSGKEASFLAGGEFPFPVVQPGAGSAAVTIMFKEYGVRLKFVATLTDQGTIHLRVTPEVSSLDFADALTISGFTVPALTTRRIDTEVELHDGQSFAVAGLIDNRMTEAASKIPWLGDVPIIGKLFHSRTTNKSKTELMVLVTPTVAKPLDAGQAVTLPAFPRGFLDQRKFDGKTDEKSIKPGS